MANSTQESESGISAGHKKLSHTAGMNSSVPCLQAKVRMKRVDLVRACILDRHQAGLRAATGQGMP